MNLFLEVKFKGGLGNQLFQYATGRSLSIKKKIPYLLLNIESYQNDGAGRKFGLLNFQITGSVVRNKYAKNVLRKGTKANKFISYFPLYNPIQENGLKLHQFPDRLPPLTSLSGYWQSELYFREIRPILQEELAPLETPPFPDWLKHPGTVAVHIRRTDYLVEDGFGSLSEKYYHDAISMIRSRVKDPIFIFFSDDLAWCKERFSNADFLFCEEQPWEKDYLQLYLMSKCRHQIIANSSFSWWAAWLNNNPAKLVVRPQKPFLDNSLMYESYYPVEWINIEN